MNTKEKLEDFHNWLKYMQGFYDMHDQPLIRNAIESISEEFRGVFKDELSNKK